jgi:dUTP pyrophosphatase
MTDIAKIIICSESEDVKPIQHYDSLFYDLKSTETININPSEWKLIKVGIKVAMPKDCFMEVRPRSGMALKHGVTVLNTPGTVDSDYRDEIGVILINHSNKVYMVETGDRIAQAWFHNQEKYITEMKVDSDEFNNFEGLHPSVRGTGGFGSTGD